MIGIIKKIYINRKRLPHILQSEYAECGLACLAMLFGYYGCKISLSELRQRFPISLKGMTLYQFIQIGEQLGFKMKVMRIDFHQLKMTQLPCIIHWNSNHYIVIKKMTNRLIILHDPARGERRITYDEFNLGFTGIILEVAPKNTFNLLNTSNQPASSNVLARKRNSSALILYSLLMRYRSALLKLFIVSILIQLVYILGVKISQKCIDYSSNNTLNHMIYIGICSLLCLKCIEIFSMGMRAKMISNVGAHINKEMGDVVMKHMISLRTAFFENRHIGDIVSRVGAIEKIRHVVTEGLVEGMIDGIVSLMMISVMLFFSIKITCIILTSSMLYLLFRIYYNHKANQAHTEMLHARSIELSHFMETLRAIPAIKLFSKEWERFSHWSSHFKRSITTSTKLSRHKIQHDYIKNTFFSVDFSLSLGVGCLYLVKHALTIGMLYALLAYRQQFMMAICNLADKFQEFKTLKLHLNRMDDIVLEPAEILHTSDHSFSSGHLSFKNISYCYPMDTVPILKNISINIKQKECIAITGPSGCGKTTLLKILMGLLIPTDGNVYLDAIPVYPNYIHSYRKILSGVMQNDILLSGTIRQNISFFSERVDDVHLLTCAKLAGISDEISTFPMGFETFIGDMGAGLSGGQKQRLLLARALYARPRILFLDEATSHLDLKKEQEVNLSIRSLDITIIMVAHRKETISMADRIISL